MRRLVSALIYAPTNLPLRFAFCLLILSARLQRCVTPVNTVFNFSLTFFWHGVKHLLSMPNQRSKDKSYVSLWMASADKARLKAAAKSRGITLSELVGELLDSGVQEAEFNFSSAKTPDALADAIADGGIAAAAANASPSPVSYGLKKKAARRKATRPAPVAKKKAL